MSTKSTTHIYYQIPKILHEDQNIKGQHIYIFMILYDQLRQQEFYNKTNQWLSKETKIGLSQLKIHLNELEEWGYLMRKGHASHRKFYLGQKFNNRPESNPVQNLNRPESNPNKAGIDTYNRPESGLHNKNLFKNISKNVSYSLTSKSKPQKQPKWPELTEDDKELVSKYRNGLIYPPLQLTGTEFNRAKVLAERS